MSWLQNHCKSTHYELVVKNNGADRYCMKDDTRVEGPFEFGIKPARRNVQGETAERNAAIKAMGAREACR